uniref:Armadillo repeat-containing domain-containing protein n=1 Tax=Clastoptera arizonana TaxID=38151 RepID=A0A1B6C7Z4_9HEMI
MVKTVKSISKTKYEDRNATSKVSFEAVNVEIKLPNTLVLLLSSDEDSVLVQVLSTLDKYAAKSQNNVEILHKANIVDKLIALLDYPQLCVKRFTIKLLSEMCFYDDVCENLLKDNVYVEKFMEYLKANADLVLKEFSASIIAQLTKHSEGYSQVIKYGNTDVLLTNLACSDPDILNNCLEIIKNLLSEPYGKNLFVQNKGFRFAPLINLLASEYPAIQNLSLDVLTALTAWASDDNLQEMFLNEGGIKNILETIQNYEMRDIHSKCLDVLSNVCENHLMLKALQSSGTRALLSYIDNIYDSELRVKALCTVLKLASTSIGRKMLLENEILDQIIPMVVLESMSLCVCQGLVHLIKDSSALCKVIEKGIIDMILTVIKQESRDWETREAAVFLLYEILCRDMHSCEQMVQNGKQEILIDILLDKKNNLPVAVARHLANILGLLSTNETIREKNCKTSAHWSSLDLL